MRRLITFAIEQRFLVLILALVLAGVGVSSMLALPIDAVPDVTNVQVQINTNAPGLGPLEVEKQITFPVEVAMAGLPRVTEVRSLSKFGLSQVTVVFEDGTDIYRARGLVLERLQAAREEIPEGLGQPVMGPISTGLGEIFQYVVARKGKEPSGSEAELTELRTLHDWVVKLQLRTTPGVTEINSFGGFEKQFQVVLEPESLQKYDLTLRAVMEAIAGNNANVGGGYIEHAGEQYVVRGLGLVTDVAEIEDAIVTAHEGAPIHVRDLGTVRVGPAIRQGAVTRDGRGEVVTGIAMMLMGENSRVVSSRVRAKLEAAGRSLPADVELVPFYDRTELVDRTIATVRTNLLEGALLVIAVLFLMLGNIRAALIVAVSIPLSMLFAFSLMVKVGIAGSLMSLGAVDFGLIVDGSVVMVENSVRKLALRRGTGAGVLATIRESGVEVARPIVSGVGIIIVVYLPILTLEGIEGKMFRPMALTVVFALAGSLLLTLTLTPALTSLALRKGDVAEKEGLVVRGARRLYRPVLDLALRERRLVTALALAAILGAAALVPGLGSEFIPRLDEGSLALQVVRLPSVSLEESVEHTTLVERALLAHFPDEVESVVSKTGRAEIATDPMGVEISDVIVLLKPRAGWKRAATKEELVTALDEVLSRIPGLRYGYSQPIELRVAELIAGVRSDVAVKVFGDDLDVLSARAEEIARVLRTVPGAADVKVEQVSGLPSLEIRVDPSRTARHGIHAADVLALVEAIGRKEVTTVLEGERRFDLVVTLPERVREDPRAVGSLLVATPDGGRVPLSELADVEVIEGPAQVSREMGQRRVVVEANVRGRDIGSFVAEARGAIDRSVELPAGYRLGWGGQFENLERARTRLLIVVPLALSLILVLLFTTFGSMRQALLVFSGIPFAAVGGVLSLHLRGLPFSISAGVGFIALSGVAVLNGVVLVSHMNRLREEGKPVLEAVREGALVRLRPVLATALVASLGFVPMAMSASAGAEVQRPLATVVVGGLITSTLLTLVVLPALYVGVGVGAGVAGSGSGSGEKRGTGGSLRADGE